MHVLEYLGDPNCTSRPKDSLWAEYRLLCSGTIFREIIGDWSKSEAARFLLAPPLLLYAASRPFWEYPLELVLRLTVARVEETKQGRGQTSMTSIFYPDGEVAQDLAALLTVLCRRLITVSGKASERYADHDYPEFDHVPLPLATSMRKVYWPRHPLTVVTSIGGQKVIDNNPPQKPVDPKALTALLLGLPRLEHAESIVASARLYGLALELIREQPNIAYQLLISSVETIANETLQSFQPDDDVKVEHQKAVFDLVMELGLAEEAARKVAVAACKREHWATRKFKKFLTDNVDDAIWDEQDEMLRGLPIVLPRREDFEQTLGKVYGARSKATHLGEQFPAWASYSGGPTIPVEAATSLFVSASVFPPVVWFEGIVNKAIKRFWERSVKDLGATHYLGRW